MVLRSVFKRSGSVSKLIVQKIIPRKVIAVSLQKCYDVSIDQTIVKMKKKIDDYVVHKGDSQNITFNLVQF